MATSEQLLLEGEWLRGQSEAAQQRSQALHRRSQDLRERSRALLEVFVMDQALHDRPASTVDQSGEEHR